jgi:hypothetical protein
VQFNDHVSSSRSRSAFTFRSSRRSIFAWTVTGVIASTSSLRLVDEVVSLGSLLGDGVDRVLEDVALASRH